MAWREINEQIARCRSGSDPRACLERLFQVHEDGAVAFALGNAERDAGNKAAAARYYTLARRLFPKAEFKAKAAQALASLGAIPGVEPGKPDDSVLDVVTCTKEKIWDREPEAPRFVPAKDAYRGEEMLSWLASGMVNRVRWLILSARYGFIEPEQPISNYDVTFSDADTGPVTTSTLVAQVAHQVRWADAVPLRQFRRVKVLGSQTYVDKVRAAFEPLGAVVEVLGDSGLVATASASEVSPDKTERIRAYSRADGRRSR